LDYIARWLGGRFISPDYLKLNGMPPAEGTIIAGRLATSAVPAAVAPRMSEPVSTSPRDSHEGAPTCSECGMLMVPNGACYKCENCGSTSGCS
jgi:ribonucleoside-diphosphate reductase alpha chain